MADFGLMFYNARWYDPALSHFTQADTLIPDPYNSQDYNRYAYTRNNPVKYIDPSGHKIEDTHDGDCDRSASGVGLCVDDEGYHIDNEYDSYVADTVLDGYGKWFGTVATIYFAPAVIASAEQGLWWAQRQAWKAGGALYDATIIPLAKWATEKYATHNPGATTVSLGNNPEYLEVTGTTYFEFSQWVRFERFGLKWFLNEMNKQFINIQAGQLKNFIVTLPRPDHAFGTKMEMDMLNAMPNYIAGSVESLKMYFFTPLK